MRIMLLLSLLPLPALAQVTTNDNALKALAPAAPPAAAAPPAPGTPPAKPAFTRRTTHRAPAAHAAKPAPLPQVPQGPPPNPVILPPPPVLPVHAPPVPPAIKPDPAAPTTVAKIEGGTRLVFGAGNAALNQASLDALEAVATAAKADPHLNVVITAWAPGVAEDPSTPHRLSLDRALAARAVLIHAGIASERIYAVAKGTLGIDAGPPDRMDVVAARPRSTPAGAPAPAAKTTPPASGAAHS